MDAAVAVLSAGAFWVVASFVIAAIGSRYGIEHWLTRLANWAWRFGWIAIFVGFVGAAGFAFWEWLS